MSQRRLLQSEGLTKYSSTEKKTDYGLTILVIFSLAAAWLAAGSTGLISHPLRRILTLSFLAIAILAPRPCPWQKNITRFIMFISACAAIYMIKSSLQPINVLAVALVLAVYSIISSGFAKRISHILSASILIFAIYRMVYIGIPTIWLISDNISRILDNIAKSITSQPILTGPTFAGIDFLVLMVAFWIFFLTEIPKPKITKVLYGFAGIFSGHLCYLIALSYTPQLVQSVTEPAGENIWSWAGLFHKAIPWNFPVLACGIQLLIAACMFRWTKSHIDNNPSKTSASLLSRNKYILWISGTGLAILLSLYLALYPNQLSLDGKKIVFNEKGFLNWLKPEHGQYGRLSSGMYGMLPVFVESLGGTSLISENLSQEDLSNADVLVLLFPDEPWEEGQLERIWNFVKNGGSLLVMAEHTTRDSKGGNRFNEVLEPTGIRVEFDCATYAVGGWLQSYDTMLHPATAGIPDERNQFGVVIGASLNINWPAMPLLIGRWGWSDIGNQGSSRAMMGDDKYNSGERLGDLVLAAEQPFGKGRIIAFGDTSSLTNGINVSSYVFTSRLFGYLAGDNNNAHPMWKQFSGIILCVLLFIFIFSNSNPQIVTIIALFLAISLAISNIITNRSGEILPDGRYKSPNNLAYVDSSHLEAYSGESWRPDGIGGLMLTLMRNDYLALSLAEFSPKQIERADLLISIAPSKSFSRKEQEAIKDFVMNGGNFIVMAGKDDAGPASSLLSQFGFTIGSPGTDNLEPIPLGYFKSPYLASGTNQVFVRFHAAWPVYCNDSQARIIAYGRNNVPVIIIRNFGKGKVVVIGDTCFAMNKNLEWEDGETFEGLRENADFWRWFITVLRDQENTWIPPALQESTPVDNPVQEGLN